MNTGVANQFFEVCSEALSFLVTEHGYKPPVLKIDQGVHFSYVIFMGKRIAIECIYDERERMVEFKVAQMIDGEPAKNYEADKSDRRIREHFFFLFRGRGATKSDYKTAYRRQYASVYEKFKVEIQLFSDLLKKYGQDILEDDPAPDVFSRPVTDHF